jgi:alpha-tubulin suppressor-like RCC1 family protein
MKMIKTIGVAVCIGMGFAAMGCGSDPTGVEGYGDDENIGEAEFELSTVPSGVGCVRVTVTGTSTVTKDFTLAANASTATLNMDRLPIGTVSIDGAAYATTCGTGSTLYTADRATALLESGVVSKMALTFRKNNPVNADVNFVGNIQALRANGSNTYVVVDGLVYGWGYVANSNAPLQVSGLTDVTDVAATGWGACALKSNGTVWCWGDNSSGQAGVASPTTITTPVQAGGSGATGFTSIAGGSYGVCGIKAATKEVKCWGYNFYGELAVGNTTSTITTPTSVAGQGPMKAIDLGMFHTCFLGGNSRVQCSGYNGYYQLGDGTTTTRTSLTSTLAPPAIGITTGDSFTCALLADGTAKCWGNNYSGQLGDGTVISRSVSNSVTGLSGAVELSAGSYTTYARLSNGNVLAWGDNASGQLGDGTNNNRTTPFTVPTPAPAEALAAGGSHVCILTTAHDIYCWGDNYYGQLGDGTYLGSMTPVKVRLP